MPIYAVAPCSAYPLHAQEKKKTVPVGISRNSLRRVTRAAKFFNDE
jgi:hypothetical protein